ERRPRGRPRRHRGLPRAHRRRRLLDGADGGQGARPPRERPRARRAPRGARARLRAPRAAAGRLPAPPWPAPPPAAPPPGRRRAPGRPSARRGRLLGRGRGVSQRAPPRLADMKVALETSRLLAHHAARPLDRGANATAETSAAKLYASERALEAATQAVRIHGA